MADSTIPVVNKPVWIDLASSDPAASRAFYARVFGWTVEVNPDPQYGGYALAKIDGRDVAGIGPAQAPGAPTAWSIYVGTTDTDALAEKVRAAGGSVVMPPFDIGDQGRTAVFQDPSGAFICGWQASAMGGFGSDGSNTFAWAELSARGIDRAIPFYAAVFGWDATEREMPGGPPYVMFQLGGEDVAGGMEMSPMVPAEVPSFWMVYFGVDDVDASFKTALEAGAREMMPPTAFPGGRFAILGDPQGGVFGLHMRSRGQA
jgi:predicted enzyme related to lactoylglutathione lyase